MTWGGTEQEQTISTIQLKVLFIFVFDEVQTMELICVLFVVGITTFHFHIKETYKGKV